MIQNTKLPDDVPHLQPYLCVSDAARAINFYTDVLGAKERYRLLLGDGRCGHAELALGEARFLLSDEFQEMGVVAPGRLGGTAVSLLLYVEDVDAMVAKAVAAGATQDGETRNEFFGDRAARIIDPFGHRWFLHQRLETLEPEEIKARFDAETYEV